MTVQETYACQSCTRTDLKLTQNGRVKSHAANGKRASADNPHCPGGSDWPREHVRGMARMGDADARAKLIAWGEDPSGDGSVDNRPTAEEVFSAEQVTAAPGDIPDDVLSAAYAVLEAAQNLGIQGTEHIHRFEYADDGNGHSGSFCPCGASEEDADGEQQATNSESRGRPPVQPNPHREPLTVAGMRAPNGIGYTADVATTGDGSWETGRTPRPSSSEAVKNGASTTDPSSSPGTTATAPSASTGSRKANSSGASETASTSTPSASRSGSVSSNTTGSDPVNDATDFINSTPQTTKGIAAADTRGENDVPRDRWGRYLLPHPQTGAQQPWTRCTTMSSSIADTFALSQWSQRMVAKGITLRPDLYALASGFDVSKDKDDLNSVCEQAKNAAGDKVAANLGTAMHNFTAAVDRGESPNIPPTMLDDVNAYSAALKAYGLELVPDLIERRVVLTRKTAGEDIGGTFDRVYRAVRDITVKLADGEAVHLPAGSHVIGDLKTGRDLSYGWGEIAIQEVTYSHAVNENGVWNSADKRWERLPFPVSEKVGIVVHLPIQKEPGAPACVVYAIDLEQGWEALKLCAAVRKWRKAKKIAAALEVVDQPSTAAARAHFPVPGAVPAPVDMTEDTREANAYGDGQFTGRAPQPVANGYRPPSAAQLKDHPSVAGTPAPRPPTWEEKADTVTTKAEASEIYQAMRPHVGEIGQSRFNAVVKRMQDRLNSLVEQGA